MTRGTRSLNISLDPPNHNQPTNTFLSSDLPITMTNRIRSITWIRHPIKPPNSITSDQIRRFQYLYSWFVFISQWYLRRWLTNPQNWTGRSVLLPFIDNHLPTPEKDRATLQIDFCQQINKQMLNKQPSFETASTCHSSEVSVADMYHRKRFALGFNTAIIYTYCLVFQHSKDLMEGNIMRIIMLLHVLLIYPISSQNRKYY